MVGIAWLVHEGEHGGWKVVGMRRLAMWMGGELDE